jgi:thioredoxin reductase (NADPH)
MEEFDVIIVGGASAGLTAGIYASRRKLKTIIITKDIGGQTAPNPHVENYPGFKGISGLKLMQRFEKQVRSFGVKIVFEEMKQIEEKEGRFLIKTCSNQYLTKSLILAFGKTPRNLNVPGEREFQGKGISYCATCDMPIFRDKTVAVIGGGNSALDAAIYGSSIAKKVYLIHRRDEFRGFETAVEEAKKKNNIEFVLDSVVIEFKGDKFLRSTAIKNVKTNEMKELEIDGAFIEIGSEVKTDFVKHLVKLDENGHVVINNRCETFYPDKNEIRPGIFAAGDLTNTPFKQIVISAGEGAKAALQAYNYLHGVTGNISTTDWDSKKRQ